MKKTFVCEFQENEAVDTIFLVKNKTLSMGKTGKPYLSVSLMDKTGDIDGKVWDDAEKFSQKFEIDDFARVRGRVVSYMGKLQLKINNITAIDDGEVPIADFLPTADRDLEEMFSDLLGIVESIKDRYLKELMIRLMEDPVLSLALKQAPAAKGMHHVYLGGLLEHILSLCSLIDTVCAHYGNKVNRDLLIAGAILHDIGKTRELSFKRAFGYTDEGRLLGHITIGVEIVADKAREIENFPHELSVLLKHMILSHHGEYEYGSPKRPKTLEATILSYLDDLDAKVNSIQTMIDADLNNGSNWTGYHRLYERYIYKDNLLSRTQEEVDVDEPQERYSNEDKEQNGREKISLFGSQ